MGSIVTDYDKERKGKVKSTWYDNWVGSNKIKSQNVSGY